MARLAVAGAVMMAIIITPIAILMLRARSQAARIADLERRGCTVEYSRDVLGYDWDDDVPELLRAWFGDDFSSEVVAVSAIDAANAPSDTKAICDACQKFRKLRYFSINGDAFRFDQIASWPHLHQLEALSIRSSNLTDNDLKRIGQLSRIRSLDVTSPRITSAGLHYLAGLPQLESLDVDSAPLDGSGPPNPAGFPQLTRLYFENSPQPRDEAVINLGPLPNLTEVVLDETQIGDQAMAHLASGGKLENVFIQKTQITDASLESLSKCSKLSWVDVTETQVTDSGVISLSRCADLTFLNLSRTKVSGKGFGALSGKELTLVMNKTQITDQELRELLQSQAIHDLSLQDTAVTGVAFKDLPGTGSLQGADLTGAALTAEGIKVLATAKIPTVTLARTPIDDATLMLIVESDHILDLDVSETKVTAQGVEAFYEARKQRLLAANREESLYLTSDHPGIAEQYHPSFGMIFMADDPVLEPGGLTQPDGNPN